MIRTRKERLRQQLADMTEVAQANGDLSAERTNECMRLIIDRDALKAVDNAEADRKAKSALAEVEARIAKVKAPTEAKGQALYGDERIAVFYDFIRKDHWLPRVPTDEPGPQDKLVDYVRADLYEKAVEKLRTLVDCAQNDRPEAANEAAYDNAVAFLRAHDAPFTAAASRPDSPEN